MASSSVNAASLELELLQLIKARGSNVAGSQEYPYPSHVQPTSFVSTKLSGNTNYGPWQEQMTCLMESHDMLGFIDGRLKNPKLNVDSKKKEDKSTMEVKYADWKRSDSLVKGWIFGSLSEAVMHTVVGLHTANEVWKKLKTTYSTPSATTTMTTGSSTNDKDPTVYVPLVRAIVMGDWEKAQEFLDKDENALTAKLNQTGNRALHYAIGTGKNIQLLKNLLKKIDLESLPTQADNVRSNVLHYAGRVGNTDAAEMLVEKNPHLLFMVDNENYLPIHRAIFVPQKAVFLYLLKASKQYIGLCQQDGYHSPFEGIHGAVLLTNVIFTGLLDVAYDLIKEYPEMARTKNRDINTPLSCLAKKFDVYYSGTRYNFYQRFVYSHVPTDMKDLGHTRTVQDIENVGTYEAKIVAKCSSVFHNVFQRLYVKFWKITLLHVPHVKHLQEDKVKHKTAITLLKCICTELCKINKQVDLGFHIFNATIEAAQNDTPEAIEEIVIHFPQAIWSNDKGCYLLQMAITHRCQNVYNLLVHQMSDNKYLLKVSKDKDNNNILHLAAQLAPTCQLYAISGAALQMQREVQWFQEVEKFAIPKHKEAKNKREQTPIMMFRIEHNELRKEGEQWMKKTADSYTITAALIITIVFAAAITVPGGNDGETGKAIYTKNPSFIIFAIADAISLFTSTTSLLLFLSILTARYSEEDFHYTLPKRLIFGLATLFLSVSSMMVAFSATLYLMFGQGKAWIVIPVAALTCLPIASFVTLQFPLLVDLVTLTYGRGIFHKQSDRIIY